MKISLFFFCVFGACILLLPSGPEPRGFLLVLPKERSNSTQTWCSQGER